MCEALSPAHCFCRTFLAMFQCMILCAGLGTRLRPLTQTVPKPLVPIGDRPMLSILLEQLQVAGGTLRAVNTHHRPEKIKEFVERYDPRVTVSHEPTLRGTAGGIAQVRSSFGPGPVVIWNGDILAQPDLGQLVKAVHNVPAAMAVVTCAKGEGTCGLGEDGRIVRLRGECFGPEVMGANYVGILALQRDELDHLPNPGCLVGDYLLPKLRASGRVLGITQYGGFSDVGTLRAYLTANLDWLRLRGLAGRSFAARGAEVSAGVRLVDCVVGEGAKVEGQGQLERVVVWPGAVANAPLADCIVTSEFGVLPVV